MINNSFNFKLKNAILSLGVMMNKVAKKILTYLEKNGYNAYLVGGYVRDLLLGIKSNDIDICTNAPIKEVSKLFKGKANQYGSLNLQVNEYNIDITTFRKENKYEQRKPIDFVYTSLLEQDLERRDFTMNAICMDKKGKIYDYYGGVDDINKGIIRMIGNIPQKLTEDPLRILRAIRFATTYDFTIDLDLEKAIIKYKDCLKNLSFTRKKEEISKILLSKNYQKGLSLLKKYHLLNLLEINYLNITYTKDLYGMWAQMEYSNHYPFTKQEKETIVNIREILAYGSITYETLYKYGLYLSLVGGEILGIDADTIYQMYHTMPIHENKDLKMSYLDMASILELPPSKEVKDVYEEVLQAVLNQYVDNSYEEIKNYLLKRKGEIL